MTRHGKGQSGMKYSAFSHYRRKTKKLDTGGSGGGMAGARGVWFEVKNYTNGKLMTVDYKPGNSHLYS